tara:strand:- start:527 stop:928 length:402 start_codon:yes stop_codon:yes gene_type:complete
MNYKAQIKEIHKLDRKPFGNKNDIYTYEVTTTKHKGLLYTSELSVAKGDFIEYDYVQQKNGWKIVLPKQDFKKPLYNNYEKKQDNKYQARLDTGRSILLQVAFKEASQAYIAGNISVDEVEQLTNMYFKIIDK